MKFRKLTILAMAAILLVTSSAIADTAVDTIMNVGTTQVFTDETVSREDLETILRAGLAAASAINQQPWYFVAVTNQDVMKEISGSGAGFAPPAEAQGKPDGGAPAGEGFGPSEGASAAPMTAGGAKAGLGDSPASIIIYRNDASKSPNADFDCGLVTFVDVQTIREIYTKFIPQVLVHFRVQTVLHEFRYHFPKQFLNVLHSVHSRQV